VLLAVLIARRWLSARGALWAGMLLAAIPASLLPHIKAGGFLNNLLPVVVLAGGSTLVLLGDLVNGLGTSGRARAAALWGTLAAAGLLLLVRRYDPAPYLVTAPQRQRAQALNQLVRGLEGGVFIPMHPFLAVRNGVTTPQVHGMAQWDAFAAGMKDQHLFRRIEASSARWMILDTRVDPTNRYVFERGIEPVPMMIGHKTAPAFLLRRRGP
jgi:hypothetical protein